MLSELHIENLAVIPEAEMILSPGLNVITGETGAGKTILAHAISLLLGTRADSGMIRPGAPEAVVEALFDVPEGFFGDLAGTIDVPEGEGLSVRRRISRDGRSRAYVGGRTTTVSVLEQLTGRLLAFSAQHEQRRLMMADRQLEILDDFAGSELMDYREEFRLLHDRRLQVIGRIEELTRESEAGRREGELLEYQVAEIEAAGLRPGEEEELESERGRLIHATGLKETTAALAGVLVAGEGGESLKDRLSAALAQLEDKDHIDERIAFIVKRLRDCIFELDDLGRDSLDYSESINDDPARLRDVEERLDLINGLKRKYGNSIDDILVYGVTASERLKIMKGSEVDLKSLSEEATAVEKEMLELALGMRRLRRDAAARLREEASGHLRDLAFVDCDFDIRVGKVEGGEALSADLMGPNGADSVEFYVSFNPGMPPAPLRETASGGELSRVMLAIKSAVSSSREVATLVFDEIDAGIGGETGSAVGAKLRSLAGRSQIICITHLPQIACHADSHFSVIKKADSSAKVTETGVLPLEGEQVVDEMCRMMGSDPSEARARAHAESLLRKAAAR